VCGRIDCSAPPGARGARLETTVRELMLPLPKAGVAESQALRINGNNFPAKS
jgi:hypothetical protein